MELNGMEPIDIGSRRELLLDDFLLERFDNASLTLHRPQPQEIAIRHDAPWEGNVCFYHTVFQDGDLYRMYYRGAHYDESQKKIEHQVVCYAQSRDGIEWEKPELGLVEFAGSKNNNIVWDGLGSHNFSPCLDTNPNAAERQRYKALASKGMEGLYAFGSLDGIHWQLLQDEPVITQGKFDSQNLPFWDAERGCYVEYHRDFRPVEGGEGTGVRDIVRCTSDDFINWSEPEWLKYPGAPDEHLYTNQINPYPRAPHIYMGFPKRFMPDRRIFEHEYAGLSDAVFMSSRDGLSFKRWGEAFIRPGPQPERWLNRNNMINCGFVQTASPYAGTPDEQSFYSIESYYRGSNCAMRRFTLRLDGFVSLQAPLAGGEALSRPLIVSGQALRLNYATSAAGGVRVEVQDLEGKPLTGMSLAECPIIYGDQIDAKISWQSGADLGSCLGKAVRLRLWLADADVYALRFA
jgi:hypothetical protein